MRHRVFVKSMAMVPLAMPEPPPNREIEKMREEVDACNEAGTIWSPRRSDDLGRCPVDGRGVKV